MTRLVLVLAFGLLLATADTAAARSGAWQRPVNGPLLRPFAIAADRFARGQHRGVDLAAPLGSTVRTACGGRVSFAGRVPRGRWTVSVRCGHLIATYQQLGSIGVRRGESVGPGTRLGTVGRSEDRRLRRSHVHLGARVAASGRYVDPLSLIGPGPAAVPVLPPAARGARDRRPLGPAPARPVVRPALWPVVRPALRPSLHPQPARAPAARSPVAESLPWTVWLGLLCFGLGLPLGGLVGVRRRRRRVAVALAQAAS